MPLPEVFQNTCRRASAKPVFQSLPTICRQNPHFPTMRILMGVHGSPENVDKRNEPLREREARAWGARKGRKPRQRGQPGKSSGKARQQRRSCREKKIRREGKKRKVQRDLPYKPDSVLRACKRATAIILLGRCSRIASSHLPAAGTGPIHAAAYLMLLPVEIARFTRSEDRLVSVALIRASRRRGVTSYGALRSPDFPPAARRPPTIARGTPAAGALLYRTRGRLSSAPRVRLRQSRSDCGKMTHFPRAKRPARPTRVFSSIFCHETRQTPASCRSQRCACRCGPSGLCGCLLH